MLRIFYEETIVEGNCSIRIVATKAETEAALEASLFHLFEPNVNSHGRSVEAVTEISVTVGVAIPDRFQQAPIDK